MSQAAYNLRRKYALWQFRDLSDMEIAALTVYGEARGEGKTGWRGVAWVIKNRMNDPRKRFGDGLRDVCHKNWQFSCWNLNDPVMKMFQSRAWVDSPVYAMVKEATEAVFAASSEFDGTQGATHYHASYMRPSWADSPKVKFRCRIGRHLFYTET